MKKFKDIDLQELEQIVNRSKELRKELDDYIQTCEFDWISDKFRVIKDSLSDWSISYYSRNFIKVESYDTFFNCIEEYIKNFSGSDRMLKKVEQVRKLRGTNLFDYHCRELSEIWFEDEINFICKFVEDACYELHCGKVGDKSRAYLECFFDPYEDYLYDEETETYYKPTKLDAA